MTNELQEISSYVELDSTSPTGAVWAKDFKRHKVGDSFGCKSSDKRYWRQKINDVQYGVHNLIWIKEKGLIPEGLTVDHIDNNGLNNHIENLRLATKLQQLHNRNAWSQAGLKGVGRVKNYENYCAYIMYPKRGRLHLGYYKFAEHAAIAHDIAASIIFNKNTYYKLNYKEGFWLTENSMIKKKVLEKIESFFQKT